ncbi:hypothetical protein ACFXJ5_03645 [Streptomyces sp. NPDC059373]
MASTQEKHGTIVLSRAQDGYRDLLRRYAVLIDDTQVGWIARGQTLRFDVPAGPHRLQLKISWCSSAPLTAMVEAGETTSFLCAPGGEASETLTSVTAGAGDYIALRPTPEPIAVVKTALDGGTRFRLATALGFFGGGFTFIGAWIWHYTGVARDADNVVVGVSLAVALASMLAFRLGRRRRAGRAVTSDPAQPAG